MLKLMTILGAAIISSTQVTLPDSGVNKGINFSFSRSINKPSIPSVFSIEKPSSSQTQYSDPNDSAAYFSCPTYGPFRVGDPDIDVSFTYRIFGPSRQIIERLRVFSPSGSAIYSISKTARDYIEDSLDTVTFTLPIHDFLTINGFTFKFEILNKANRKIITEYGTTIYPVEDTYPSAQQLKSAIYETKNIAFYGDGTTIKPISEKFDFTTIGDYLDIDYYYRLNIKDIFFNYQSVLPFSCLEIYLRFDDPEYLFINIPHDGNSVSIPLRAMVGNNKITLKYQKFFYINKRTLQPSTYYDPSYALSEYLYLPINGKRIFNNTVLYLDFVGLGYSNLNVSIPIRYVADRSLVGLCGDSDYYVEGGVK